MEHLVVREQFGGQIFHFEDLDGKGLKERFVEEDVPQYAICASN